MLIKWLRHRNAKYLLSLVWGIGLAILFKRSCDNRSCIVYKAPSSEEMKKTFKFENKCYVYTPEQVSCKNKNNIIYNERYK